MDKNFQLIVKNQEATIALLQQISNDLKILSQLAEDNNGEDLNKNILDNTDLKQILKIRDTKLFELKKAKIFTTYNLKGKDLYFKNEIIESIRKNKI